ncbi:hypothetical protein [Anabaena catenula]|uniref:Uncharacterized protein n=1 Tax=Anabaena catenula FACHB-362 TaxID=2692877 RepID=A0ABR8J915_9NOST|nr:hypothetical protein [Anabaena catenula]MBD2694869.1 hypothetical protein [Anabaena catenula FACHB-362]
MLRDRAAFGDVVDTVGKGSLGGSSREKGFKPVKISLHSYLYLCLFT